MKTVIIIEPDKYLRLALETKFRQAGFSALTTDHEDRAYLMLEEDTPDLLVFNTMNPEIPGEEIVKKIRDHSEWKDIPLFVIVSDQTQQTTFKKLGASKVVAKKNLQLDTLIEEAQNLLE